MVRFFVNESVWSREYNGIWYSLVTDFTLIYIFHVSKSYPPRNNNNYTYRHTESVHENGVIFNSWDGYVTNRIDYFNLKNKRREKIFDTQKMQCSRAHRGSRSIDSLENRRKKHRGQRSSNNVECVKPVRKSNLKHSPTQASFTIE